jgi:hypothetical protein
MLSQIYRAAAGAFTLFVVVVQYWLVVRYETLDSMVASSVKFFSFFTILTNILAAAALLVPLIAPHSRLGRFFARPSVRTAIAGYIIMVGTVYYLLLRDLSQRQGWPLILERTLHYVTPPLYLIDWALFVPKRNVDWRVGLAALGFPLAYVTWTLVHGALSGWYPYPFIDVADLGYARTLVNIAGLIAIFLLLEVALVAIGWCIGPRSGDEG